MTNAAQEKGKRWERACAGVLSAVLRREVVRTKAGRFHDAGDLTGVPDWTFQCKDYKDVSRGLREAIDSLAEQMEVTGTTYGAAIVKRPGHGAEAAYFVMPLDLAAALLEDWLSLPLSGIRYVTDPPEHP